MERSDSTICRSSFDIRHSWVIRQSSFDILYSMTLNSMGAFKAG